MVTRRNEGGYMALLAVLIIGSAAATISLALLMTGVDSQRTALVQQQFKQARALAVTCAEEGLQQIHDNTSFTGSNTVTLGQGSCTYTVANTGGSARTVTASGTVGTVVRNVQVSATVGASTISVTSWQDVSAGSGPTYVQSNGSLNDVNGGTIAQAFSSNTAAGNLIVAAASWDSSSAGVTMTCSDTQGNTFTTVNVWNDSANTQALGICYAANVIGGADTVTVTFGGGANFRRIVVSEYSGIATVSPVDVSKGVGGATATTATDAVSSTAATTTQNGDLIFGAVMDTTSPTTIAAGTNFTQRFSLNGKDFAVQDRIQTTAGSIASTQTFGAAHLYDAAMVAFKPKP